MALERLLNVLVITVIKSNLKEHKYVPVSVIL